MMWKIVLLLLAAVSGVGFGQSMVGGFRDIDVNDQGVRDALIFAVAQHNRLYSDMFRSKVAEVTKAQVQMVTGERYRITVIMGKTPCRKDEQPVTCEIHPDPANAQHYQCTFTVISRAWLDHMSATEKCLRTM